ncbi:MAG TPA: ABC transporter ATP-binding protein [Balneolales bacterium]|nr:ABC transporter ATP-binding protein [Balneolales bacterium]
MSDVLIKVENLSKKFCRDLKKSLWYGVKDIAGELTGRGNSRDDLRPGEFWSVNDISFELKRGECLGLIGPNGAGKSTLLKILTGLIKADKGRITMRGRVGALIELGAGFNPILTGRENIFVNGAVLGFTKEEINNKLDSIIEFSELKEFIETPVQNYSSGMKVRLGFAVAAQMEPDVLIVDEVLAVGDIGFRAKCFNAMNEIAQKAAVIFVSHGIPQVARVATDILLLDHGNPLYCGKDVEKGFERYYDLYGSEEKIVSGSGKAQLHDAYIYSDDGDRLADTPKINHLDDIFVEILFSLNPEVKSCFIQVAFFDKELRAVAQLISKFKEKEFFNSGNNMLVKVRVPRNLFAPGMYTLTIGFAEGSTGEGWHEILGRYQAVKKFRIVGEGAAASAPILLDGDWMFKEGSEWQRV